MKSGNVFENNSGGEPDEPEYEELSNIISFDGFNYDDWTAGELEVLQPRLVALGYTEIRWRMGDCDAFGPLTRLCFARNSAGELKEFIYG